MPGNRRQQNHLGRRHGPATGTEDYMEAILNIEIALDINDAELCRRAGLRPGSISKMRQHNATPIEVYRLLAYVESLIEGR